jgi:hypothetical protein
MEEQAVVVGLKYGFVHSFPLNGVCTANARALASRQAAALESHSHAQNAATLDRSGNANAAGGTVLAVRNLGEGLTTLATGGSETRPRNVAYHPRLHV